MADTDGDNDDIDDSLYSRQRYVLGDGAMQKLAKANVLIIGLGGVGVEVAKNVILAGTKHVTFYDNKITQLSDVGTQFFLRQQDVDDKLPRSKACYKRLAELNPYVTVDYIEEDVVNNHQYLKNYQCVIVSELTFDDQIGINDFCRSQSPVIPFISCDVIGVFSYVFCDFGKNFQVLDEDGEEPKEILIQSISKGNPSIITTLENRRHGLDTGHVVIFREVKGMTKLNGEKHKINYIDPFSFSIDCDTTPDEYEPHTHSGVCFRTKEVSTIDFKSLQSQLKTPDILLNDLAKLDTPIEILTAIISLHKFKLNYNSRLSENFDIFINICKQVSRDMEPKSDQLNEGLLKFLATTSEGVLPPLCAAIGGVASQEVLKAISGKFSPLKQWLLLDAMELAAESNSSVNNNSRYSLLNTCLNSELVDRLHSLKLFMVGCGAIGCEMLKNFALLGIGSGKGGSITITDNDLIEKSNLNRQFLFRPHHIQKSKALTAAESVLEINPDLQIIAQQNKVCPETQAGIYNDSFYEQQDIVVNALDNVEARRYVDGRCVSNQRPLLETGTMGAKGHVQVIVPHLTESYSNQRDPVEEDIPYCTLKSFPQVIEHTIQWARDKFESLFTLKPTHYNNFWQINSGPAELGKSMLDSSKVPDGFVDSVRLLQNKPNTWKSCLAWARSKFQVYFNYKAQELLRAFPVDSTLADGSLFWQSPKRPPTPLTFDQNNEIHMTFITAFSRIQARVHNIKVSQEEMQVDVIKEIIGSVGLPEFRPSNKKIETDETKTKNDTTATKEEDFDKLSRLIDFLKTQQTNTVGTLSPEHFEKDDDSNSHIDFITAASNLRASMYNIETADRFKTKRIAGRIIPAIATTTATIAGLATIELLKVVAKQPVENLKNCFLNLAIPMMVLSEPGPLPKTKIRDDLEFSVWDRWDVQGHKDFKLKDFIDVFKNKYNLDVNMVCEGVKMIYVPIMPGHKKRVNDLMTKLLKPKKNDAYTDLVVSFASESVDDDEDLSAPPVRYFYNVKF